MTPRDNCYILGHECPNEILQDVLDREQNVTFVVKVSHLDDEIVTCGSPYKFSMMNSPEISHLGKTIISLHW